MCWGGRPGWFRGSPRPPPPVSLALSPGDGARDRGGHGSSGRLATAAGPGQRRQRRERRRKEPFPRPSPRGRPGRPGPRRRHHGFGRCKPGRTALLPPSRRTRPSPAPGRSPSLTGDPPGAVQGKGGTAPKRSARGGRVGRGRACAWARGGGWGSRGGGGGSCSLCMFSLHLPSGGSYGNWRGGSEGPRGGGVSGTGLGLVGNRVSCARGRPVWGGLGAPLWRRQPVCPRWYSCSYPCPLCVGAMCTRGPTYSCTHVHPAKCKPVNLSCLILPLPRSWLGSRWAGHWLLGQSMAILVHITSDPEHACPWLGLTSSVSPVWLHEQDFCVPAGRCVSLHVCSVIDLGICVSPSMGVQGQR